MVELIIILLSICIRVEFQSYREEEEAGFVKDTLKDLKQSLISVKNILNNSSLGGNTLVRKFLNSIRPSYTATYINLQLGNILILIHSSPQ